MWEDIKPLLAELFTIVLKVLRFLWTAIKWLFEWLASAAVWLYQVVVIYCKLVYGLFTGHLYALSAMLIVLIIGYLIVNALQKKKALIYIPWYKEPRLQAFILIPVITSFLAVATNPAMVDIQGGGRFFFEVFGHSPLLGPSGHLGVPTTIWALVISFIFVVIAGAIALRKTERRRRIRLVSTNRRKKPEVKAEESFQEETGSGEEAVILNEQPGWFEERKKLKDKEEEAGK